MIATGLCTGVTADPAIAAEAVAIAMARLNRTHASSVLLFLSESFARDPQPALLAASRQSQCMQIVGCSAAGIFTEQDWVLDAPAAAAMVFSEPHSLTPAHTPEPDELILALTAPSAINRQWIDAPGQRLGGVSGDATGHGPYKVWQQGKVSPVGRTEMRLHGCTGVIGVSHGIRALTAPTPVSEMHGFELLGLNQQPALHTLLRELPLEPRGLDHIPLRRVVGAAIVGEVETAVTEGRYRLIPVIATHPERRSVTLASQLELGARMFWALRQPLAAEASMRAALARTEARLEQKPDFAIMISSAARGPGFYHGDDRDLRIMTQQYPDMPVIGFYGNGEIACLEHHNQLLEYTCTFGLFYDHV